MSEFIYNFKRIRQEKNMLSEQSLTAAGQHAENLWTEGSNMENVREILENGEAVLGLEFGSTRIKAVLIDREHRPIASGDFEWENRLEEGIWTYRLDDIWEGLQGCYQKSQRNWFQCYDARISCI